MNGRVLHVLPHRGGGAETYIDMLERLTDFEHERFALSAGRRPAAAASSLPARWPRLLAAIRRVDLVHCHGDMATALALPLLRMRPAVMTGQGLHMLRRAQGPRRALMVRALRSAGVRLTAIICSSEAERAELAPLLRRQDQTKLRIIPNGIDLPSETPSVGDGIREELGVPAGAVLGLFVGQLEARKAPLVAARAARRARAAGAEFVLALAGDGPQMDELRGLAGEAVLPLGHRNDIAALFAAADLFLQPSEREGMAFALLEAMAHGLAVVAADASSNPEAIADAGRLFPPGDDGTLAAILIELSRETSMRAALGERARTRAATVYSPARFLAASDTMYREMLATVRAPVAGADGPHA